MGAKERGLNREDSAQQDGAKLSIAVSLCFKAEIRSRAGSYITLKGSPGKFHHRPLEKGCRRFPPISLWGQEGERTGYH